jgi:hypothetical protein
MLSRVVRQRIIPILLKTRYRLEQLLDDNFIK